MQQIVEAVLISLAGSHVGVDQHVKVIRLAVCENLPWHSSVMPHLTLVFVNES